MSGNHRAPKDPPRFAYSLLRRAIPEGPARASLLGDLHEEYEDFTPRRLRRAWYVAAALAIAARYTVGRISQRLRRHRPSAPDSPRSFRTRAAIGSITQDLRYALRTLVRQPGYALVAVSTLALGIGANTAIFSVIYGSMLRPLPFPDADRVMRIADQRQGQSLYSMSSMSVLNFADLSTETTVFERLVGWNGWSATLSGGQTPQRLSGQRVASGFFDVLRLPPQLGREFVPEDEIPGATPVTILSDGLWRANFDADPEILGRTVVLNAVPHTVVGVAHREFTFSRNPVVWVPLIHDPRVADNRLMRSMNGLGRLKPGMTHDAGLRELRAIFARLQDAYPEVNTGWTVAALPLRQWLIGRRAPRLLQLFGGAVALVLVIACVNVANLTIARSETRQRELALRAALGAGRFRLARQFLSESLLIGMAGGILGAIAALWGVKLLVSLYGSSFPRADEIGINGAVLAFTLVISVLTAVAVGILPALQTRPDRLYTALQQGGRIASAGQQVRQALVVVEVALAVMLVAGAGLLTNSVWRLSQIDLGVRQDGVLTFDVSLPDAKYPTTESITRFYDGLLDELTRVPGVEFAGATSRTPLQGGNNSFMVVRGAPEPANPPLVEIRNADPGFFQALDIQLTAGRMLTKGDRGRPALLVNEAFVRAFLPERDPVGHSVVPNGTEESHEIVGVVSDIRDLGPTRSAPPAAYWPLGSGPYGKRPWMTLTLRAAGDPLALLPAVRERVRALDPDLPLMAIATMEDLVGVAIGTNRRSAMALLAVFAGLALVLGAVGIYGVMSYTVTQRTREVGVRIALGATGTEVVGLVLRQGLRLTLLGLGLGLAGAVATGRLLDTLLYEVGVADPATLAVVATVLLVTAALACVIPARRAASVEAVEALRHE